MPGLTLRLSPALREGLSGFALPVGLLMFNRLAPLIPVSGAISSAEGVVFWSQGALWFFAVFLLLTAGLFMCAGYLFGSGKFDGGNGDAEAGLAGLVFLWWLITIIASAFMLPWDGWEHWGTPIEAMPSLIRIFFFTWWTPVLAGMTLVLQLVVFLVGRGRARVDFAGPLLVLLFLAGGYQFGKQAARTGANRQVLAARLAPETKKVQNEPDSTSGTPAKEAFHLEQISVQGFVPPWFAHLQGARKCGATLVDWPSHTTYAAGCPVAAVAKQLLPQPDFRSALPSPGIAGLCFAFVLLMWILFGIHRETTWKEIEAAPVPRSDVVSGGAELVSPFVPTAWVSVSRAIGIAGFCAVLTAVFIPNNYVLLVALGVTTLMLPVLLYIVVVEQFISKPRAACLRAFASRDRRRGRAINPRLEPIPDAQSLASQPSSVLAMLPLLRPGAAPAAVDALGGRAAVPIHPSATLLTKVDYAVGDDEGWRQSAAAALPANLFPHALQRLAAARYPEPQLAALRCPALPRPSILQMLLDSSWLEVRTKAWDLVCSTLSEAERERALKSPHADVRGRLVRSGEVSLSAIQRLGLADPDPEIRAVAWELSREQLNALVAHRMSACRYADVRLRSIESGLLSKRELGSMWLFDEDFAVRQRSGQEMITHSIPEELELYLQSDSVEVRGQILDHANLPSGRLEEAVLGEWDPGLRRKSLERVRHLLNGSLSPKFSQSPDPEVRIAAIPTQNRERLLRILISDPNPMVRRKALAVVGDLTIEELERIAESLDPIIRASSAARLPTSSRVLARLRLDPVAEVRSAAQRGEGVA